MNNSEKKPRVGLGVIVVNSQGEILIGQRLGDHAPYFSIPGGSLEPGETFEAGAIREVKEETDLEIINPKVIGLTNNLQTYLEEGVHFISVVVLAESFSGQAKVMEPKKCSQWLWVKPDRLPQPHFEASQKGVECYLKNIFYQSAN